MQEKNPLKTTSHLDMFSFTTCAIESLRPDKRSTSFFSRRSTRSFIPLPPPLRCLRDPNKEVNSPLLFFIFLECVKASDARFIILESLWTEISEM